MKNFIGLVVTIGTYTFTLAAVATVLNYLFGWNLGIEGTRLPDDPMSAGMFLVCAGICWAIAWWLSREKKPDAAETT